MNNVIQTAGFVFHGICADGSDIFELLGPLIIFGIYIIGAIIKAAAKKGAKESEDESESELKKAIEKRRQEILQRQTGKTQEPIPKPARQKFTPVQVPQKPQVTAKDTVTSWEKPKSRPRDPLFVPNQRTDSHKYAPGQKTRPRRAARKSAQSDVLQSVISHKKLPQQIPTEPVHIQVQPQRQFLRMIRQKDQLRSAIILKEILDKPLALRE